MNQGRHRNLRKLKQNDDDNSSLCVIGYACQIYPCSETSDFMSEERHLQVWNGEGNPRIDRFDSRLLLHDFEELLSRTHEDACPTEQMEEEMCEEERYKDMFDSIERQALEGEENKTRKAEVSFNYAAPAYAVPASEEVGSDSEDEPYTPPLGVKLPVGLITPDNLKQSHIIEKTAVFVVEKGPQMEIVIKAKQRNNSDQFGFLEFDNLLNPYYKYICKLIREKKYTPAIIQKKESMTSEDKSKPGPSTDRTPQSKKKLGALAAIADDHASSDDSDSDCELHPSLFAARKRSPSPDIIERNNAAGPKQKPERPEQVSHIKAEYNMHQSNDIYASLFKSISQVSTQQEKEKKKESERRIIEKRMMDIKEDPDWRTWWESFYGISCPYNGPLPMVPPPPDMEKAVYSYASLVAQHGPEAEATIVDRCDPNLDFMLIESPYYSYYLHRVRHSQWEIACRNRGVDLPPINPPREVYVDANLSPRPASSPGSPVPVVTDASPLNRKQRRRLQDAVKYEAPPPGMIGPMANKISEPGLVDIPKTHSSPALMVTMLPETKPALPSVYVPSAPVSFSLTPKEDVKLHQVSSCSSLIFDDPIDQVTEQFCSVKSEDDTILPQELQPPAPPQMLSNSQIDRKEKAKLFMEKLLSEKRKKALEEEEMKIRELENQRAELEKQLRAAETVSITEYGDHSPTSSPKKDEAPKSLDVIDKMLNKRITNLLGKSEATEDGESDDEQRAKKDKKKKTKHRSDRKRSRSHSRKRDRRSRSRSRERRSRSPSYSRNKRKRRSRSSSRDRRRR